MLNEQMAALMEVKKGFARAFDHSMLNQEIQAKSAGLVRQSLKEVSEVVRLAPRPEQNLTETL